MTADDVRYWVNQGRAADIEPTPAHIERAVTSAINGTSRVFDSSVYIQWLCTQGEEREASTAFGWISTDELLVLLAIPDAHPQTCKEIGSEIRRRFTDAHLEGITQEAANQAQDDAEDA